MTYSELAVRRLLAHLQRFGIELAEVIPSAQAPRDGSEFDGQAERKTDRGFSYSVEVVFGANP